MKRVPKKLAFSIKLIHFIKREDSLNRLLLEESANYIFNNIYMPAAQKETLGFEIFIFQDI